VRISHRRTESFAAYEGNQYKLHHNNSIVEFDHSDQEGGTMKQLMSKLNLVQPQTLQVSRRDKNDLSFYRQEPQKKKGRQGFIERQIR